MASSPVVSKVSNWGQQLLPAVQDGGKAVPNARAALSKASGVLSLSFGVIAGVVVCLFVGIYVAVSPLTYSEGFVRLFPHNQRPRARDVFEVLGSTLQR